MTELNDAAPLTVTLKGGGGYDAPWLVIRGSNPDEVTAMLRNLRELPGAVVEASALLQAANNAAPIANVGAAPAAPAPQAAPQQQAWAPAPAAPQQQQGPETHPTDVCAACAQPLRFKVINRKSDGKQFKMWTCPNQRSRDDGHTSNFAN